MTDALNTAWDSFRTSGGGLTQEQSNLLGERLGRVSSEIENYVSLLMQWNKKMDLISPAPLETVYLRHVIDSAVAFELLTIELRNLEGDVSRETLTLPWLDIGSGAGLPGVIFGLLGRNQRITLLEPRAKRVQFLNEVKRRLKLENVSVIESRLEDLSPDVKFALAISRALRVELSPLKAVMAPGGLYVQMSGASSEQFGSGDDLLIKATPYALPGDTAGRELRFYKCFT